MVVRLLELPAVELEDRVRAELLENPALEEGKEETHNDDYADTADSDRESPEDGGDTDYDSLSDYLTEDDITAAATTRRRKSPSRTAPLSTKH